MATGDKNNKKRFSVRILGDELVLTGDISRQYVKEISDFINTVGREITQAYPHLPRRRLLGLTLVNITDKYYKEKENNLEKTKEINRLQEENKKLKKQIELLKKDNEELSVLLEEVDG